MNDFVKRYKNSQAGVTAKQQKKEDKKGLTKALHEAFKVAGQGQVAGINHHGTHYLLTRKDVFENIIQNGGKMLLSPEQKEFFQEYQVLLHIMESLDTSIPEESDLFTEVDQFTFDFSQHMNDPNGAKKRREIKAQFKELIDSNETLTQLYTNLKKQLFQPKCELKQEETKPENKGKLT